ncbi:FAD-dependent pyridine nucleotide-disulphide oxidoreductase [Mesorhizobium metallidurans STM 2683]|uniref:FAD-dependent pyridine nucleotide-disulphide oxidoreductase n=1 Tax=Mesorhizobium metallidurans STM 2683 TaxID=1297569 RepID=M5F773_9HYPH|nr:FAD-dependent oxidoreductase [Mesorhizobium metallidurans]CCV07746.1 FAD-dependent pyridine nucleotide-disulphide oxidoreductase [Mesorhizobium metallidurans STM 2683]
MKPHGHGVGITETRARAGALLEQGAAFVQLEASAVQAAENESPIGDERRPMLREEHVDVVVIGAGQNGLSVGYHLARKGMKFVVLEARQRVGDIWRSRWDSLRLFTPARFDGLIGMPFPAARYSFPAKDDMADYLEAYARKFSLPVRTGVKVDEVTRSGDRYIVTSGQTRYVANHVVAAASSYQKPKIPDFAASLDPSIRQFHSGAYKNPSQLNAGSALLVGASNSGAEIAMDLARTHQVWLAGRHPGNIPVAYNGYFAMRLVLPIVFRIVFHRLLTVDTPMGRKVKPGQLAHGLPLIRVKPSDLDAAGVRRVSRVTGVSDGKPMLDDGQVLDVSNVIWCIGFRAGLDWIKLPVFDETGRVKQYRGIVEDEPGLYVCGLHFQHSTSSTMIHGAARDAGYVADKIGERMRASAR